MFNNITPLNKIKQNNKKINKDKTKAIKTGTPPSSATKGVFNLFMSFPTKLFALIISISLGVILNIRNKEIKNTNRNIKK